MHFTYRSKVFLSQSGRYRWSGEATALSCTMRMQDHLASVTPLQVESPSMWVIIFKWDILITSLSHPGLQNTQKKEVERMTTQKTRSSEKCCLLNKVWLLHTWTHRGGVMFTWPRYLKIPARIAEKLIRSHSQQNNDWQWKIDGRGRTIPLWAGSHCYVPYALLNSPRPMHIWATVIGLSQFLGERGERGLWHEVWSGTYWGGGSS